MFFFQSTFGVKVEQWRGGFGASLSGADARYTKAGVSDARLIAAYAAATLRWLEGLLVCLLFLLLLFLAGPSPRIVASSRPYGRIRYPRHESPTGHENERCRALHERCNILEALYNLRITLNAADDETATD